MLRVCTERNAFAFYQDAEHHFLPSPSFSVKVVPTLYKAPPMQMGMEKPVHHLNPILGPRLHAGLSPAPLSEGESHPVAALLTQHPPNS